MTIIVGREANSATPRLGVTVDGNNKFIGAPGSVPMSVSRKHCRIEVLADGSITVANVAEGNVMYVNGTEYKLKTISNEDMVELGPDRYMLDIQAVIKASSSAAAMGEDAFNILPLKKVWEDYQNGKIKAQVKTGKMNALSAIPGVLSMVSMALYVIPGFEKQMQNLFGIIAAVFAVTFLVVRLRVAGKNPIAQKKMDEDFQDRYVCPNPTCNHFIGNQPYKLVLKNGSCPWCKSRYFEVED